MKGLSSILIFFAVFILTMNKSLCDSDTSEVDKNNIFIVNYVLIANHIKFGPFYFEPNLIKTICENNIESLIIKQNDWKQYGLNFEKSGKIKSIFKYGTIIREFKYSKINDTLFVTDSMMQSLYKFYFVKNRITSFEYKKLNSNGEIFEKSYKIEYNEKNFAIEFFNDKYFFDYKRKLLSYGKINKNILSFLFCGSGVDIFRELNYNQDTIVNTINKSNLDKYFEGLFPPPYEFEYNGIKNSIEKTFYVYRKEKLIYKFILNKKGLVSNVLEYYSDDNVEEYNFIYTFF